MANFANDIAEVFHTFEPEEVRQCLRSGLDDMGPEDAEKQFARAEQVLEGFLHAFEGQEEHVGLYMCLTEAKIIAMEAKERARAYATA